MIISEVENARERGREHMLWSLENRELKALDLKICRLFVPALVIRHCPFEPNCSVKGSALVGFCLLLFFS